MFCRGERSVAKTEFGKITEFLEVNSVDPAHARQAIASIRETTLSPEAELFRREAQVAQRLEFVSCGGFREHDDGVAVVDMRGLQESEMQILFVVALHRLVGLLGGPRQIAFDHVRHCRAGIFRIKIDIAVQ
jgi:hypothetical protein